MVVYRGSIPAPIAFVGEAPGREEDERGEPFVGRSGKLLDRWLAAMGLSPGQVLITNVVRCRPPLNRPPTEEEAAACRPHLDALLAMAHPRAVVALGRSADRRLAAMGIAHLFIYHPSYYVRGYRRWEPDVARLAAELAEIGLIAGETP